MCEFDCQVCKTISPVPGPGYAPRASSGSAPAGDVTRRKHKAAINGLRTFPGKSLSRKDFPGKIVCHSFNVKQTVTVFCVNWRIILLTGLLSLIREVMQHDPALLIFTLSALSGQVPAHQ